MTISEAVAARVPKVFQKGHQSDTKPKYRYWHAAHQNIFLRMLSIRGHGRVPLQALLPLSDNAAMWAVWHGTMYLQAHPYAMSIHEAFASRKYACALCTCMKRCLAGSLHVCFVHAWSICLRVCLWLTWRAEQGSWRAALGCGSTS